MEIVKEYQSRGMKHIQYDGGDADVLKERFTELRAETVDKLCQWLRDNKAVVDAIDCFDSRSGWQGTEFKIGNADLSCNGYCLSNSSVELFLSGGQNPMWY